MQDNLKWHWPPEEWPPAARAYAILARRYQISKTADLGHVNFETTSINDCMFEYGFLTSLIHEVIEKGSDVIDEKIRDDISKWVIDTANKWLLAAAKDNNAEMKMCEGGCERVTCADKNGKFLCVVKHDN